MPVKYILLIFFLFGLLAGCHKQSSYEKMADEERAKNIKSDSLFLGYAFGMSKQEFYDHSIDLNKQRKVYQGEQAASMRYEVKNLKYSAHMNYFAEFNDGKLYKMPVRYMYNGWAPWNRKLWADSLEQDVLRLYKQKLDTDFIEIKHPELGIPAYVTVIGNKRMAIFEAGDKEVAVNYVDLSNLPETEN